MVYRKRKRGHMQGFLGLGHVFYIDNQMCIYYGSGDHYSFPNLWPKAFVGLFVDLRCIVPNFSMF